MTVIAHLDVLSAKKAALETKIQQGYSHHDPDYEIASLKKQKLTINDEMTRLRELAGAH